MATAAQRGAILAQLDAIEAEMKRIGLWTDRLPDPPATGPLDPAAGFDAWLQGVFLPKARTAAETDTLPARSQVGVLALRQYDHHSTWAAARPLLRLLNDFDRMVEAAAPRGRRRSGR
ncbi:YqcC family protein [Roseospira goensis]|uniref:Uncharacterized protein YqcC (DUF446 family) n=1 Tax=Roseospira goensis TaxID=391922 RepID=A0A7W6RYJ7_9PROT|nr:YqcC family protein [Roseospira goensis]MBB4285431.1 uncharacterized protein YqcC (DUF446 family) [Roseospira goensis]